MLGVTKGLSGLVNPTSEYPWSSVSLKEDSQNCPSNEMNITHMKIMFGFSALITINRDKIERVKIRIIIL